MVGMLKEWLKEKTKQQLWRLQSLREKMREKLPRRGLGSFGIGSMIFSVTPDIRPRTREETLFAAYAEMVERLEKWTTRG